MWRSCCSLAVAAALLVGCTAPQVQRRVSTPGTPGTTTDRRPPVLKVHLRDGSLVVFTRWAVLGDSIVEGDGTRYRLDRTENGTGPARVRLADAALFESNVVGTAPALAPLLVVTAASVVGTIYCAENPKACWGSCPTFYTDPADRTTLAAEGFSSSIAPSLEERDIDHLYRSGPHRGRVRLELVNEALETHVIRYAHLQVVPLHGTRRAFQDADGAFWYAAPPVAPSSCRGADGDCTAAVAAFDRHERTSRTDSTDLAVRETVELTFATPARGSALLLATRQSLVSTFLFYQTLGWLGESAGHWMAALARGDSATLAAARRSRDALGGITVEVARADGSWQRVGEILEYGPLAADVRLLPLPDGPAPLRVRLVMAQGAWRLDWAALTTLEGRATPVRVAPTQVRRGGTADARVLEVLRDTMTALTTMPGDRYALTFALPDPRQRYEVFLDTRGYYLEWLRREWRPDADPRRVAELFADPRAALRRIAPDFKRIEAQMDSIFWRSAYAR